MVGLLRMMGCNLVVAAGGTEPCRLRRRAARPLKSPVDRLQPAAIKPIFPLTSLYLTIQVLPSQSTDKSFPSSSQRSRWRRCPTISSPAGKTSSSFSGRATTTSIVVRHPPPPLLPPPSAAPPPPYPLASHPPRRSTTPDAAALAVSPCCCAFLNAADDGRNIHIIGLVRIN